MSMTSNTPVKAIETMEPSRLKKIMDRINRFVSFCQDADSYFSLPPGHVDRKSYVWSLNGLLFDVYSQLELLLQHFHREELGDSLHAFYDTIRSSSWVKRCQDRPLGYTGDYLAIEQVLLINKLSKINSLGYEIDRSLLESPLCQHYRNKIEREISLIRHSIDKHDEAEVLCFSVGGCSQFATILSFLERKKNYTLHLHDTYGNALKLAKKRLVSILNQCEFYNGHLFRFIKKDLLGAKFDLITMGGIMDYITDKVFILIFGFLYAMLKKGGCIYITQLAKYDLYECVMHYVLFWDVIYRSEDELRSLIHQCGVPDSKISITTDLTNISYLVEVVK